MKAKFIVKNFGPIKDAELDLRNVNVFIGPQASGKSTLAKLYTICKSPLSFLENEYLEKIIYLSKNKKENLDILKFKEALKDLNIHNFLNSSTFLEFNSEIHYFKYSNNTIIFERKFETDIKECYNLLKDNNFNNANTLIKSYVDKLTRLKLYGALNIYEKRTKKNFSDNFDDYLKFAQELKFDNLSNDELITVLEDLKFVEFKLLSNKAIYIPAERIIVSILRGATWGLQNNSVPIPKHILNFAAEYEKATKNIKEFDLSFIKENIKYKNVDGNEKIYFSPRKSIALSESATGFQSLIPLILPLINNNRDFIGSNNSFVIEEPEISLYPKAQYDLIKYLEKNRQDGLLDSTFIHTYTTHSPYILASFNNMLYAYKKSIKLDETLELEEILPKENWLNPENFNAYTVENGTAIQILDRKEGLIQENSIDEVSELMNDDFSNMIDLK
jgi:predicted ATPase